MDFALRIAKTSRFLIGTRWRFTDKNVSKKEYALWLKRELQNMGPTYIKIGQFISTRKDIFDKELVSELCDLQDNVDVPFVDATPIFKASSGLRALARTHSLQIAITPIAQASIGQVHLATVTKTGVTGEKSQRVLALKVRRPDVKRDIAIDLTILKSIVNVLNMIPTRIPNLEETKELLLDFEMFLIEETDYENELRNWKMLRSGSAFNDNSGIVLPFLREDLCCSEVVAMDFVESKRIRDVKDTMSLIDRKLLASKLMDSLVQQLVVDCTCHCDLHSGNIGILSDGRVIFYDMGNIITLDQKTRNKLKRLLFDIINDNLDDAVATMKTVEILFEVRDDAMAYKLLQSYATYIRTVDPNVLIQAASSFGNGNGNNGINEKLPIKFKGTVFRIVRVFGLLEGICKDLDPSFSYEPIFAKYMQILGGDGDYLTLKALSDIRKIARYILSIEK